jgi:hypothetical protein
METHKPKDPTSMDLEFDTDTLAL